MQSESWRPIDLARAVGVSAQTVRKYEELGFIPPATRSATGYRRYGPRHVQALRAARLMSAGYGWLAALQIMQSVHRGDLDGAVAAVDACHARLHQARRETMATLAALRLAAEAEIENAGQSRSEPLRIGELSRRVGVRASTVRLWERHQLLHSRRDPANGYRLYGPHEIRRVQIVALLRRGGYGFEAIRTIVEELAAGTPEQAVRAAERRLAELMEASRRCSAATAALWEYVDHNSFTST